MDDLFSDDGLDDLGENDLQELENAAVSFTQQQARPNNHPLPNGGRSNTPFTYGQRQQQFDMESEDDDLDNTFVIDGLDNRVQQQQQQQSAQHPLYGLELLSRPLNIPNAGPETPFGRPRHDGASYDPALPRPQNRLTAANPTFRPNPSPQFPPGSQYIRPVDRPTPSAENRENASPLLLSDHPDRPRESIQPGDIANALRDQVRVLELNLTSARGEASILRTKHETAQKSYEADIARLKKQHSEQLSRQERAVEAAVAAQKSVSTELLFTRQDLRDELDKGRRGRKEDSDTPSRVIPKRNERWAVADGFEDSEILPSPSRGAGRRTKDALSVAPAIGDRTPRGKRKRMAIDSPRLELEDRNAVPSEAPRSGSVAAPSPAPAIRDVYPMDMKSASRKLDLAEIALNHSSYKGGPTTFDCFARYAFPSEPGLSFAANLFRSFAHLGNVHDPMQVYVDFCMLICDLWSRCIKEKYNEPISNLVALLTFLLQMYTTEIAPKIVAYLVTPAMETIWIVTSEAFHSKTMEGNKNGAISELHPHIPTTKIMSLLYLVALACTDTPSAISQFWRIISIDFVLSTLMNKQHPSDFFGVLTLLRTSALPTSIGPIAADPEQNPDFVAVHLLDEVSSTLESPPKWAPPDSPRLVATRLEVVATLSAFARTQFGRAHLAKHVSVIPRLVIVLSGAIDALYDAEVPEDFDNLSIVDIPRPEGMSTPEFAALMAEAEAEEASIATTVGEDGHLDPLPPLYDLIRETVKLLHLLITDERTSELANIPAKLVGYHGASQRYLLTLGRLNFCEEDQVLERGVDGETQVMAHELLELIVTPDEGEGIEVVFG